jgi:hypothetical protein
MQLKSVLALGLAAVSLAGPLDAAPQKRFLPARFFYDGDRNSYLLAEIRRKTERKISFNHRFSWSYVSCGIACGTFFYVDRATGGVATVPESPRDNEMQLDVATSRNSDRIRVIFGPRDDAAGDKCWAHSYRWVGKRFVPVGKRSAARCPG